ncbi:MAG: two-component sensor histidine kinase [Peptococcaceae bacterium]|nr:two-component sensor histidine kinase [Peptococcaceae bacterium]
MRWSTRLILLVVGMVLLTGIISGGLALHNTTTQFNRYVGQAQEAQALRLAELLGEYYGESGSFQGVEMILGMPRGGMGRGPMMMRGMGGVSFYLSDTAGRVLWHPLAREIGERVSLEKEKVKYPVKNKGETIAYLLPLDNNFWGSRNLESQFTTSVLRSIVWGTALSIFIAVLLGLGLSRALLAPLQNLVGAAREFSQGNLSHRLEIKGNPDFGEVFAAFNNMAENLSRQEKLRRELVADVAHELRTPLTILSGHLESMQEGIEEITPENITSLHDEVLRLRGLVDDLQQLSLAEAKQLPLSKQEVDMARFIRETFSLFEAEAKEKEVEMILRGECLPLLNIDKGRMRQVLINLLSNALRYVPQGGLIRADLKLEENHLLVKISDNGPGIEPEDLPYIFNRFYRGDKSRTRMSGGTGLGLAIAKGFVEAHGGSISVESVLGKGTEFTIRLPLTTG